MTGGHPSSFDSIFMTFDANTSRHIIRMVPLICITAFSCYDMFVTGRQISPQKLEICLKGLLSQNFYWNSMGFNGNGSYYYITLLHYQEDATIFSFKDGTKNGTKFNPILLLHYFIALSRRCHNIFIQGWNQKWNQIQPHYVKSNQVHFKTQIYEGGKINLHPTLYPPQAITNIILNIKIFILGKIVLKRFFSS